MGGGTIKAVGCFCWIIEFWSRLCNGAVCDFKQITFSRWSLIGSFILVLDGRDLICGLLRALLFKLQMNSVKAA